ncbi:hypothetical protein ACHAPJ_001812 [Fusarium lateritium]
MSSTVSDPEEYTHDKDSVHHLEDSTHINMNSTVSDSEDSTHINTNSTVSDPEEYTHDKDSIHHLEDSTHINMNSTMSDPEDSVQHHEDFIQHHEDSVYHLDNSVHEHKDSVLDHEDSDHESAVNNATSFPELFPNQPQKEGDNVPYRRPRFLIWGRCRFIARRLKFMIQMQGYLVRKTIFRGGEPKDMIEKLDQHRPSHVFIPVFPSDFDGWEKNREEATITDIVEPLNLITCCWQRNIHCTVFIGGDNYKYDESHPQGGRSFTEDDLANMTGDSLSNAHYHVSNVSHS